jgi:DsbC/DsbD-like thiol-disulfide interchange protein
MVKEIHSHAHEEGVPGTVNLKAVEGDDTYLGQALFPVPSSDPNDPLNWPKYKYLSTIPCRLLLSLIILLLALVFA